MVLLSRDCCRSAVALHCAEAADAWRACDAAPCRAALSIMACCVMLSWDGRSRGQLFLVEQHAAKLRESGRKPGDGSKAVCHFSSSASLRNQPSAAESPVQRGVQAGKQGSGKRGPFVQVPTQNRLHVEGPAACPPGLDAARLAALDHLLPAANLQPGGWDASWRAPMRLRL